MGKYSNKILFVDHEGSFSGSTISLGYIVAEFVKQSCKVIVLTKDNAKGISFLLSKGAEIITYSASPFRSITLSLHFSDTTSLFTRKWFRNLFKDFIRFFNGIFLASKIISRTRPGLIYLNEYVTIQFALIAKLYGIPVAVHVRSLFIKNKLSIRAYLLRKALQNLTDNIFAITDLEASQVRRNIKSLQTNIKIIPEFLNQDNFTFPSDINQLKNNFGYVSSTKIITFLGGISYIKGSINFIESIRYLINENSEFQFILAGKIYDNTISPESYTYYKKCMDYIYLSDINPHIKVIGEIENVKDLISISDIIISCSVESHFSRPIIEAWALKKAVIATDLPHTRNLIDDGINGLIVPVNDAKLLSKTVELLIKDEKTRLILGQNGYDKARTLFSDEKNLKKIVNCCLEKLSI
jgi:glycosyltransferase involved in cell wall biosynthesis